MRSSDIVDELDDDDDSLSITLSYDLCLDDFGWDYYDSWSFEDFGWDSWYFDDFFWDCLTDD